MDRGFKNDISQFMPVIKIVVAANKKESGASLSEGKKVMRLRCAKYYVKNRIIEKVMTICLRMPS